MQIGLYHHLLFPITTIGGVALSVTKLCIATITLEWLVALNADEPRFTAPPIWIVGANALSPNICDGIGVWSNARLVHDQTNAIIGVSINFSTSKSKYLILGPVQIRFTGDR